MRRWGSFLGASVTFGFFGTFALVWAWLFDWPRVMHWGLALIGIAIAAAAVGIYFRWQGWE